MTHPYLYIYICMKYCIGPMNVIHMYIYIFQVCPVAPKNLRVIFASILHTFNYTTCFSKYQIHIQHAVCNQYFVLFSKDAMVNAHWTVP